MSAILESRLDQERLADCIRNDAAMGIPAVPRPNFVQRVIDRVHARSTEWLYPMPADEISQVRRDTALRELEQVLAILREESLHA